MFCGYFYDHTLSSESKNAIYNKNYIACRYLGKDSSMDEIKKVVEQTSFKAMERNLKSNLLEIPVKSNYFRKGCIGDHKNVFNAEQLQYINNRLEKEFKHTGLYSANL